MAEGFTGLYIPKEILEDEKLSWPERIIMALIKALDNDERRCFASNTYMASITHYSRNRVSELITGLVKKEMVIREIERQGKRFISRKLWLAKHSKAEGEQVSIGGVVGNPTRVVEKSGQGSRDFDRGWSENREDIIHNIKNEDKDYPTRVEAKKKYAEFVRMRPSQYAQLVAEHGEARTKILIDRLDTYKGMTGKKYQCDYRAIKKWVIAAVQKEESVSKLNEITF